jgi:nucleoside-diphosphate-sugar epimerase
MKVFVAGGSGAIGSAAVRNLLRAGHDVTAMTRSPAKTEAIRSAGATPVVVDAFDRAALVDAVTEAKPDTVIDLMTAIPSTGPLRYGMMKRTNSIRTRGAENLVHACIESGCRRLIAESIVFAYGFGDHGDAPVDERTPADVHAPHRRLQPTVDAVLSKEAHVLTATAAGQIDGSVLRFGLFYGPEAGTEMMARALRFHAPVLVGGGDGLSPWMHIDNGASAVTAAVDNATPGEIYNVTDDEPASYRTFLNELAKAASLPKPLPLPRWAARLSVPFLTHILLTKLPVSNDKAKQALGWEPTFPTYRQGLADFADRLAR